MAQADVKTRNPAIETQIQPTYRTKPKPDERFVPVEVEQIIKNTVNDKLKYLVKFDDDACKKSALELCSEIKEQVKALKIPRYKVVLQSVIGEVKGQGAYIASRCLWDTETDNYSSYSFKNQTLFCTIMVFGLYLE